MLTGIGVAALLLLTSPGLPMVWDEGNAIRRAEGIARWAGRWTDAGEKAHQPGPLTEEAIEQDWQYTTHVEGHPALYGIVIASGRAISARWLGPLSSARFGPMMLFGLAAGVMFYRMAREYSIVAAIAAVISLVLLPRVFAHAHFASYDGPLTSCWILMWATFAPAREGRRWAVLWGIALGMTLSAKATGWIAPLPFLIWAAVYRDRAAARALVLGMPVALLTFFVLNPPLWHHPIQGPVTFFQMNLSRAARPELNIATQFLGRMYDLHHPLPWYNTLVWTAVTVPVGILVFAGVGLIAVCRCREDKAGMLLAANWLVLLMVRAIPGTPPHDGVRLFLPSFVFLAALAGVGSARLIDWSTTTWNRRLPAMLGVILLYLGSASSLGWYAPQWLSYYSLLIGGLPGATARGMEPTYYWDGLDRSVLDWLHHNTGPDEKVLFGAGPSENLALLQRWGTLQCRHGPDAPGRFRWYVLQRRPSGWTPADRWLIAHARPAFRKTIRSGGWGPWRLDVPIVEVYAYQQYRQATGAIRSKTDR